MFDVAKTTHREYWQGLKASYLLKQYSVELEQLNTMDGLTGLKNRTFFDQTLTREMKRALRFGTDLSLVLIDIDHFKRINDEHGHLIGDECLRRISALLKDNFKRGPDTVARYGGEEFAVILPGHNRDQAMTMAEKIRQAVADMDPRFGENQIFVTISLGVASMIAEVGVSEDHFIQAADRNLYSAKNNGRNQVCG